MLLTIDEVARILSVNPRTVRRYIEKGLLRAERVGGSWRVSEEAVRELFDSPEAKDSIQMHFSERSEDIMRQYLAGKHRLQQDGPAVLLVFVFSPEREPWALEKCDEWMAELKRLGPDAKYDFTMTGSENGLYRLTLAAPPKVAGAMAAEWDRIKNG
jgi:excisionase family DNA binding protein